MILLALDMSTKTGWALFKDGVQPESFGLITKRIEWSTYEYPKNFVLVAEDVANQIIGIVNQNPDITDIVIEETNKTGRFGSRHSQKILEFIHLAINQILLVGSPHIKVHYLNTSDWRKKLKLSVADTRKLAKPFLKESARLKKELALCEDRAQKKILKEKLKAFNEELKLRCIHGKIDKKSISVAYVNATFNMNLKKGDNDISDAICLGKAFLLGAKPLSNKDIFENGEKNEEAESVVKSSEGSN